MSNNSLTIDYMYIRINLLQTTSGNNNEHYPTFLSTTKKTIIVISL
jgi:hypothetical protein